MQTLISLLIAPLIFLGSLFIPTPPPVTLLPQHPVQTMPSDTVQVLLGNSPYDVFNVSNTEDVKIEYNKEHGILGGSNLIETPVALFHTSLANAISATANSMTLVSGTTLDGTTLASSTYSFVIDSGTPTQEFVEADCTGTVCTNMQRGLSVVTGTTTVSSLEQPHRRTASVDIVDAPLLLKVASLLNGLTNFPNPLSYAPNITSAVLSGGSVQNLATVAFVNNAVSAGCANASTIQVGCVQIGTAIQVASSTSVGSTAALLVIPASMATSSNDVSGLHAVITQNSGKINWNQIDTATAVTFTALDTFNKGIKTNATTTIAASSTTANPLVLNTVAYAFPAAQGSSGNVLTNNGSGVLSWSPPLNQLLLSNFSPTTIASSNASTTIFSVAVPANTLGTSNQVTVHIPLAVEIVTSSNLYIEASYGNASSTVALVNGTGTNIQGDGYLDVILGAKGSTGSQSLTMNMNTVSDGVSLGGTGGTMGGITAQKTVTPSIDSTTQQNLTLIVRYSASNSNNVFTPSSVTATSI